LHGEADISFHGFAHHVVSFTWHGTPVRILLSGNTGLPSAVEITRVRPYEVYWSPWGDVTTRVSYAFWTLESGGLHYPREWSYETNGQPDWVFMVNELTLNPKTVDDDFHIPEEVKRDFLAKKVEIEDMPFGNTSELAREIAPDVVFVPGRWNVVEVRQPDGVMILEAPISNGYSSKVIDDVEKRFPGVPIKGVITTSGAWPHIGGLREYAARGIPIYALDLNRPILERLLAAPHTLRPDTLALHAKTANITYLSEKTTLGSGPSAVELIPMRTATCERQLVVYMTDRHLLYSSDAFQRASSGEFFLPQTLSEVLDVVRREKINVEVDVGMHIGPTPWKEIEQTVAGTIASGQKAAAEQKQ
jgi:hypothetical protein